MRTGRAARSRYVVLVLVVGLLLSAFMLPLGVYISGLGTALVLAGLALLAPPRWTRWRTADANTRLIGTALVLYGLGGLLMWLLDVRPPHRDPALVFLPVLFNLTGSALLVLAVIRRRRRSAAETFTR